MNVVVEKNVQETFYSFFVNTLDIRLRYFFNVFLIFGIFERFSPDKQSLL